MVSNYFLCHLFKWKREVQNDKSCHAVIKFGLPLAPLKIWFDSRAGRSWTPSVFLISSAWIQCVWQYIKCIRKQRLLLHCFAIPKQSHHFQGAGTPASFFWQKFIFWLWHWFSLFLLFWIWQLHDTDAELPFWFPNNNKKVWFQRLQADYWFCLGQLQTAKVSWCAF